MHVYGRKEFIHFRERELLAKYKGLISLSL